MTPMDTLWLKLCVFYCVDMIRASGFRCQSVNPPMTTLSTRFAVTAISAWAWIAAALLLTTMGGMMWRPIHRKRDRRRTLHPRRGILLLQWLRLPNAPDEPPLAKMWSALPLLSMNLTVSREAKALLTLSWGATEARTWMAEMKPVGTLPEGRGKWYLWPWFEGPDGGVLRIPRQQCRTAAYGQNIMQVVLTLLAGVVIFLWACEMAGSKAGVLALAMWCFNPVALAYGHLIQTDPEAH